MDSTLKAALIAATISLVVSGLSGYIAVWSFRKQRWAHLLLANVPLPGRPFRAENGLWPSGDVVLLSSVEGIY